MRPTVPNRLASRAAVALLALTAAGLAAPATARASCLHQVRWAMAPGAPAGLDVLEILGGPTASMPADAGLPTGPARPCSGLRCSGGPAIPPAAAFAPSGAGETWAALEPPTPADGPSGRLLPGRDAPVHPSHAGPSVFHPPRPPLR